MRKRANVEDCLRHPWIQPELAVLAEMRRASSIVTGAQLKSFKVRMRWRKATDLVRMCIRVTQKERLRVREAQRNGNSVESKYDPVSSNLILNSKKGLFVAKS